MILLIYLLIGVFVEVRIDKKAIKKHPEIIFSMLLSVLLWLPIEISRFVKWK